jgi:hypothetical protein
MVDLDFAHQKYNQALDILASRDEMLRPRLIDALRIALRPTFNPDEEQDDPPPLARHQLGPAMSADLSALLREFHATARASGKTIADTVNGMSDDEVHGLTRQFLGVHYQVDEEWQRHHRGKRTR